MSEARVKKKHPLKGKEWMVALGVLGAAIVIFIADQKAPPPREPDANPPVSDYVHATAPQATRVELKRPDGGFVLVKQKGKWSFEAPKPARADSKKVDDWLKGILDATVSQKVEAKPTDVAAYGLDKPAVELTVAADGTNHTLQVGKDFRTPGSTAAGSMYYAENPKDGRLFMLGSMQVDDLKSKKVEDLRDKRLADVPEEKDVKKVVIQREAGTLEVSKNGDKWELLQPFRAPADKMDVESLLSQVKSAEAESIADEAATDLAKYGLDKPRVTVRVTDKGGVHGIVFGKEAAGGKLYAAREGDKEVDLVAKTTFDALDKKPADLRERQLITLDADKITFVQLTNENGSVKLQKVGGGNWEISGVADPKQRKAKSDTVQQVINSIRSPAFKHVEEAPKDWAQYGLDKPVVTVQVNSGTGTSQIFSLGKKTPDGNYYARGVPNAAFQVMSYVFNDLNVKPDAFKDTSAPAPAPLPAKK